MLTTVVTPRKKVGRLAPQSGRDSIVSCDESKKMVDAVNRAGGCAKLKIYTNTDHDSWTATYNNREVFEWLLSQRNQNVKALVDSYSSNQDFG